MEAGLLIPSIPYVTCGVAHGGGKASALMAFDGEDRSRLLWSSAKHIGRIESKPIDNQDEDVLRHVVR